MAFNSAKMTQIISPMSRRGYLLEGNLSVRTRIVIKAQLNQTISIFRRQQIT